MARLKIMSYFVAATTILLVMVSGSILPNYIGIFQMSFACDRNLFFASQDASLTGTGSIIQTIDITHSGVISPGLPPHARSSATQDASTDGDRNSVRQDTDVESNCTSRVPSA